MNTGSMRLSIREEDGLRGVFVTFSVGLVVEDERSTFILGYASFASLESG